MFRSQCYLLNLIFSVLLKHCTIYRASSFTTEMRQGFYFFFFFFPPGVISPHVGDEERDGGCFWSSEGSGVSI